MPIGLGLQRRHPVLGYRVKYLYYCLRRRDVLEHRCSYGSEMPDKTIYVIKPNYQDGVEGLLSLIFSQAIYIDYARKCGYLPYVDWKHYHTQYSNGQDNAWEYFFKQPSTLTEAEVYAAQNAIVSGWSWREKNHEHLFSERMFTDAAFNRKGGMLLHNAIQFVPEVEQMAEREAAALEIGRCIGVYLRGTDYAKLRPSGEFVQPTVDQALPKIHEFCQKYPKSPLFVVTEDGEIYDRLYAEFGERIRLVSYDSFVRDYKGCDVLSRSNVLDKDAKKRGREYLVKMLLLARCRYFVGSITQGSKFSYAFNCGQYADRYVFHLGLYP